MTARLSTRRVTRLLHDSINIAKCLRCHKSWAFTSGPQENFHIITRWCPDCIAKTMQTIWADEPKGRR